MEVQTIRKAITINAPVNVVWDVLFNERFTNAWYETFGYGAYPDNNWQEGSAVRLTDNAQNGLLATIVTNTVYDEMVWQYEGLLVNGIEDYFSNEARKIKGGIESYTLVKKGECTELFVTSDIADENFSFMSSAWDKALLQLKTLSETELIPA